MAKGPAKNQIETEDVLQAVVVADSFQSKRFPPLSLDLPRVSYL